MHCPQWDLEALMPPVSLIVAGIQVQGEVEVVAWLVGGGLRVVALEPSSPARWPAASRRTVDLSFA